MRPLNQHEKATLSQLATKLSPNERAELEADLDGCLIHEATADGSRLIFTIEGYERPQYVGQHAYPVEGYMRDADGAEMTICLYADQNNRLLEFEIIKWEDAPIINPDWASFSVKN